MLLAASCIFYAAFIPKYLLILFLTIIIDYTAGIYIEKTEGRKKKMWLIMSIVSTCLVLFSFKYFNFFGSNIQHIANFLHWNYSFKLLHIILPIGLSFHVFQSLSYVIEVYRGHQKSEHNFGIYALYVMFFPQLVAGPIERPQNLLHQFYEKHDFDYKRVVDGLRLMLWGFFKKIVIADNAAIAVNIVFGRPHDFTGMPLILATILFAFQIYCDFSGYSDIAIGSARVMGFRLMKNFDRPYHSKSISEFWKRWHISLSTWFKDYIYIPLGGNRVATVGIYFNLFVTFLISGFWHGANWTYVIWGALNGVYIIFAIITKDFRKKVVELVGLNKFPRIYKFIQIIITFSLTCFAWIFFRANSIQDAVYIATHLFTGVEHYFANVFLPNISKGYDFFSTGSIFGIDMGITYSSFISTVIFIAILELVQFIQRYGSIQEMLRSQPVLVRWSIYYALVVLIIFFSGSGAGSQFIYFQF